MIFATVIDWPAAAALISAIAALSALLAEWMRTRKPREPCSTTDQIVELKKQLEAIQKEDERRWHILIRYLRKIREVKR